MPFSLASSAIFVPTALAASMFDVLSKFKDLSSVELCASVTPLTSSISCAYICLSLLNTHSLGLS